MSGLRRAVFAVALASPRLRTRPGRSLLVSAGIGLGAAVLAAVDSGRLRVDSAVTLARGDLAPPYSPIAEAWPGRARYTVGELVEAAAGASDNTAADVLMRMVGGPGAVTRFLRAHGVRGVRVDR